MDAQFSFTRNSLENLEVFGIRPEEVLQVLSRPARMVRHLGDDLAAVFGQTCDGRHLMVLVIEVEQTPGEWDIAAARDMSEDEVVIYERRRP